MAENSAAGNNPPKLVVAADGEIETGSLADMVEWFLNFDERTARMRHPMVEELFQWKQRDDASNGGTIYPFENAEARFAIGIVQAVRENDSEPGLRLWLTDVINALHEARQGKQEMAEAYRLDDDPLQFALAKSEKLTSNAEKRFYLTNCWLEALFTAEARVLGWVYQEIYGRPFSPVE